MSWLVNQVWYGRHPLRWVLTPFSWAYGLAGSLRRLILQAFFQGEQKVPLIVVGNLTVGGVGKTPLVISLVKACQARSLRVGVVSRGYKAGVRQFPHRVLQTDTAWKVGDEPLLIVQKTGCPVVIDPKRQRAVDYLIDELGCQIILSDDGLQHYAMGRSLEIVVIDGQRGLGNGCLLPAGPLREGAARLKQADLIVVNEGEWPGAYSMRLKAGALKQLGSGTEISPSSIKGRVSAVAGIGNPQRFFDTLDKLGLEYQPYAFADHHLYQAEDFNYLRLPIVMTEKDAIKCRAFASEWMYYLPVEAELDEAFWQALWSNEKITGSGLR